MRRSASPSSSSLVALVLPTLLTALAACGSTPDDGAASASSTTDAGPTTTYGATCATDPALPFCKGAVAPSFALVDFQPKSPDHGQRYGLDRFRGKVTVVGLLSGWCHYCQSQASRLQQLHDELAAEGHDVDVVIVNSLDAINDQAGFTSRCSFPLLQDQAGASKDGGEATAWQLLGGRKDDLLVYGKDGALATYLPFNGGQNTNLSTPDGYQGVKAAILAVE